NTSDMVLRDTQTGAFEVYDIANNQVTGAAPLGQVGLDWQGGGIAPDPLIHSPTILRQWGVSPPRQRSDPALSGPSGMHHHPAGCRIDHDARRRRQSRAASVG